MERCEWCEAPASELNSFDLCPKCAKEFAEEERLEGVGQAWFQLYVYLRSGEEANAMLLALSDPDTVDGAAAAYRNIAERDQFAPTKRQRLEVAAHLEQLATALKERK